MKMRWLFAPALALSTLAGAASAQTTHPATTRPAEHRRGAHDGGEMAAYYVGVANELKLTGEQRERFAAVVNEKHKSMQAWQERHGAEEKDLRERVRAAGKGSASAKDQRARLRELRNGEKELDDKHDAAIAAVLTADQRQAWEGINLYRAAVGRYHDLRLTDAQKAQIKERCAAAAQAAPRDNAPKTKGMDRKALQAAIEQDVLTAGQRETLQKSREEEEEAAATTAPATTRPAATAPAKKRDRRN